jgi:hypothetical protein
MFGTSEAKGGTTMSNRRQTMIWMKDLIEHMSRCHDQLQWASDGPTQVFLADSLLGDLVQCQRLCEELRTPPATERCGRSRTSASRGRIESRSLAAH